MIHTERRLKILRVSEEVLLDLIVGWQDARVAYLPAYEGLPDGVQVLAVRHNQEIGCFDLRLTHPSFPVIEECTAIPQILTKAPRRLLIREPGTDRPLFDDIAPPLPKQSEKEQPRPARNPFVARPSLE